MHGVEVRTETIAAISVARVRHVGPYEAVGPSFGQLFGRADAVGAAVERVLTLSYLDPETVPPEQRRSDACIELLGEAAPADGRRWAIKIKRSPSAGISRGLRLARADVQPERTLIVHAGDDRYPVAEALEAISVREMASELRDQP
jgi:hypothetical protein